MYGLKYAFRDSFGGLRSFLTSDDPTQKPIFHLPRVRVDCNYRGKSSSSVTGTDTTPGRLLWPIWLVSQDLVDWTFHRGRVYNKVVGWWGGGLHRVLLCVSDSVSCLRVVVGERLVREGQRLVSMPFARRSQKS